MFDGGALGGLAVAAKLALTYLAVTRILKLLLASLDVLKPCDWCVMLPRVQLLQICSLYLSIWALSWTILVHKVVLFLLAYDGESVLHVALKNINSSLNLFLLVFVSTIFSI